MGRVLDHIDDATISWIDAQRMFFVGSAPSTGGRVNLSPKGLDSFRVVGPSEVAYLDLTGSGAETIAHLRDNGRITFMFCAFDGPPRIVRLYGTGFVHLPDSDRFSELSPLFPERRGVRSIITATIERVQDSCGYSVPTMEFTGERTRLDSWVDNRSDADIEAYWIEKNTTSIDGLPALDV
ncbi:MAG: pyridoxamine 5'-phosphate oxidase family protein [Acidimicrobiia bacterium]